ncbi:MAG: hypothetical protein KTR30_16155 [Saprospiraceae bacterium]|nr:hypothetical protein [Saprospiraceae bacterium]
MFSRLLLFEWRFHSRHISFLVFAAAFLAFGFALSGNAFGEANLYYNSTYNLHKVVGLFSLVAIFFIMIQTSRVVLRDQVHRMAPLIFTTPVLKRDYLATRFLGLFLSGLVLFAFVVIGLWLGAMIRSGTEDQIGPLWVVNYLWPYLVLAVPNIFLASSFLFLLANLTRSTLATYLGGILLYCLYWFGAIYFNSPMIAGSTPATPEGLALAALIDPFGLSAFFEQTQYWEVVERNEALIRLQGLFLLNRLIWVLVGVGVFVLTYKLFSFRKGLRASKAADKLSPASDEVELGPYRQPTLSLTQGAYWPAWKSSLRIEWKLLWGGWPIRLAILLWIGLVLSEVISRVYGGSEYGSTLYPTTDLMIWLIEEPFQIFGRLLVLFFAGEIMARERLLRWKSLVDSSPIRNGVVYLSKLLTLISIPIAMLTSAFLVAMICQVVKGFYTLDVAQYLTQFYLLGLPLIFFSVLILFIQSLVSNKYLGMFLGLLIAIVFMSGLSARIGLGHPLARLGIFPEVLYTNMNGVDRQIGAFHWFAAYWTSLMLLLVYFTWKGWKRGQQNSFIRQIRSSFRQRSNGRWGMIGLLTIIFISLLGVLYYQMNVLNTRTSREAALDQRAAYELKYKPMDEWPDLRVAAMQSKVDIYPEEGSFRIEHEFKLANRGEEPIKKQWFTAPRWLEVEKLEIKKAKLVEYDALHRVYQFTLDQAVLPGDTIDMSYNITYEPKGLSFARSLRERSVVANGTNIMSVGIVPRFGYRSDLEIQDNEERLKRGLPPVEIVRESEMHAGMADEDRATYNKFNFETILSTESPQIAVAPGRLLDSWEEAGRNYFHYKSQAPINHFYSYISADYAMIQKEVDSVKLSVYYDEGQAYNVELILDVMEQTLRYCQDAFGAYEMDELRLLEIPGHWPMGGYAAPGNIGLVEDRAFLTDLRDTTAFDVVTKRVSHEVAHQWFGHQLTPYNGEGGSFLVESTAKYLECIIQEQRHGKHQLRTLVKEEMSRYFGNRNRAIVPEPPLNLVDGQNYLAYSKGAVVMNAIRDLLGEQTVNEALRYLFDHHAFPKPKASMADFEAQLFERATLAQQEQLKDWLSRITIYDTKILSATYTPLPSGEFEVQLEVEAHKQQLQADGSLAEMPMEEPVNIGLFQQHPDQLVRFSEQDYYEKYILKSGVQKIRFQVAHLPEFVSVDPYLHLLDKNIYDNTILLDQ